MRLHDRDIDRSLAERDADRTADHLDDAMTDLLHTCHEALERMGRDWLLAQDRGPLLVQLAQDRDPIAAYRELAEEVHAIRGITEPTADEVLERLQGGDRALFSRAELEAVAAQLDRSWDREAAVAVVDSITEATVESVALALRGTDRQLWSSAEVQVLLDAIVEHKRTIRQLRRATIPSSERAVRPSDAPRSRRPLVLLGALLLAVAGAVAAVALVSPPLAWGLPW